MTQTKLDGNQIATEAGFITVYNFDAVTREYICVSEEYLVVGVGIPANSCIDSPEASKEGYAICRNVELTAWEYIEDHRGETVYITETGEAVAVTSPGHYPEGTTTLAPLTPYDFWDGSKWVTDTAAQHVADVEAAEQKKLMLLSNAQATIALWQTELQLGVISEEDRESLISWVNYIKEVQVIDTSKAPDIDWPLLPNIQY